MGGHGNKVDFVPNIGMKFLKGKGERALSKFILDTLPMSSAGLRYEFISRGAQQGISWVLMRIFSGRKKERKKRACGKWPSGPMARSVCPPNGQF